MSELIWHVTVVQFLWLQAMILAVEQSNENIIVEAKYFLVWDKWRIGPKVEHDNQEVIANITETRVLITFVHGLARIPKEWRY